MVMTSNELKSAQGMVSRREVDATRIGFAESGHEAGARYVSMTACVREVKKHLNNILSHISDKTAVHATECLKLLAIAEDWQQRAGDDLHTWGLKKENM
jgi:hypothetical protein